MISASSVDRLIRCPASAALPQVRSQNDHAEAGTIRHRYLQRVSEVGRERALSEVPEAHRAGCAAIDLDALPTGLAAEVSFAYDVRSGLAREIGRGLDRDYSNCTESEIPGTADVVGVAPEFVYIADYKGPHAWLPSPRKAGQLLFLALAACRAYGRDKAIVEFIRLDASGDITGRYSGTVDIFDLEDFAARLHVAVQQAADARKLVQLGRAPNASEGDWCQYCPSYNACPAKTALVKRLATGQEGAEFELMLPLTPEQAAEAYRRLGYAKKALKRIEAAIYAAASREPIYLGDGKWLGESEKRGNERLDGDIAWQVLNERYGAVVADEACKRTVTKTAIKAAINGRERNKAAAEREVLGTIRDKGGSDVRVSREVCEFRAPPPQLPGIES